MSARTILTGNTLDADRALESDVAIIGSGAGGAISADVLARAGLRVVVVEEAAPTSATAASAARRAPSRAWTSPRSPTPSIAEWRPPGGE